MIYIGKTVVFHQLKIAFVTMCYIIIGAVTCDFQQSGILTDSYEPV